eukprot:5415175-Prymnesium_polylepis.1
MSVGSCSLFLAHVQRVGSRRGSQQSVTCRNTSMRYMTIRNNLRHLLLHETSPELVRHPSQIGGCCYVMEIRVDFA